MAIYKRGKTWWVRIRVPNGKLQRFSAKTSDRAKAQELHDQVMAERWRTQMLGAKPNRTWNDAAKLWLKESTHKADYFKDVAKLKWLEKYLGEMLICEICRDDLNRIADLKVKQASKTTANRYMALVRAILRKAVDEWGWAERVPKVRMFIEPKRRIRWLSQNEAAHLLSHLPEHQADLAVFALATGLRQANILNLNWSQVDMTRKVAWIHPDQAKAGRAIGVPLNDDAVTVIRKQIGKHHRYVFTYRGNRIKQVNTKAWQNALKRAGIENFRWHDLRHTWASWHVQAGTPLHVLQELGGWECVEMVRRYAHLAPNHLAEYAHNSQLGHKTGTIENGLGSKKLIHR